MFAAWRVSETTIPFAEPMGRPIQTGARSSRRTRAANPELRAFASPISANAKRVARRQARNQSARRITRPFADPTARRTRFLAWSNRRTTAGDRDSRKFTSSTTENAETTNKLKQSIQSARTDVQAQRLQ